MSDNNKDEIRPKTPPTQLNLTVQSNVSVPTKQGFFRRSPFSSPTQKRKQFLPQSAPPSATETKVNSGSATGKSFYSLFLSS